MQSLRRRHLLAAAASAALAGCGFKLRQPPELRFRTIALTGFSPRSPLADELRLHLNATRTTVVVEAPSQAQVVLQALTDARERSVVASTATGEVRELQVRTRLQFRLHTPAGKELIAPTELVLSRDISYAENLALAKEQEEAQLYRTMQSDIVSQVLRRLASVQSL